MMKRLKQKEEKDPNDPHTKMKLYQFMKDLQKKYKIDFANKGFNIKTGEIVPIDPYTGTIEEQKLPNGSSWLRLTPKGEKLLNKLEEEDG